MRQNQFIAGLFDIAPVLTAFVPIGLLWGALAAGKGLSPADAGLMSAIVFAGSSQFVAVDLWRDPAPWLFLGFTTLIVNIRHVLMGASLARHMGNFPRGTKMASLFVMCDEAWAFAERRALTKPLSLSYYLGLALPCWLTWFLSSLVGAGLGARMGDPAYFGVDFAFAAMFIAILAGFWKGPRTGVVLLASGFVAALAKLYVAGAWYIVLGGLAGVITAAILHVEEEAASIEDVP